MNNYTPVSVLVSVPVMQWNRKYVEVYRDVGHLCLIIPIIFYTSKYPIIREVMQISYINDEAANMLVSKAKSAIINKIFQDLSSLHYNNILNSTIQISQLLNSITEMIESKSEIDIKITGNSQVIITIKIPLSYYGNGSWLHFYFKEKQFKIQEYDRI